MINYYKLLYFLMAVVGYSCSGSGFLSKKRSPHQQYENRIKEAGLDKTSLGRKWLIAADESLIKPVIITIPYSESGYFSAEKPTAIGLRFALTRGEKIKINLDERPAGSIRLFVDLFRSSTDNTKSEFLAAADTLKTEIEYEVNRTGEYLLRIQPELLASGEYLLSISAGPSLAFPVPKGDIRSIWGDPRDAGGRTHEGVDIFAPKKTPALAAADGRISRVNENRLGGKVVWLNVADKDYTLYYAHLDSQLVSDGQRVRKGDTVGLIGNTGNARTTPAHLHFGIYSFNGAIDPFPFVNPIARLPLQITASTKLVGWPARTTSSAKFFTSPHGKAAAIPLERFAFLEVIAATSGWYRVKSPDGSIGYVQPNEVVPIQNQVDLLTTKSEQSLFDNPDIGAARKSTLSKGEKVELLAVYGTFYFVEDGKRNRGWIINENKARQTGL
jgi:peptidoglycan LD-endopeptidase LytH